MVQIFKSPGDLIVQIGKDILVNKKAIGDDIHAGVADFNAGNFLQSGEDFGAAAALLLFGRPGRKSDVMSTTSYDSYLVMSSFASVFKSCDKLF